MVVRTSKLEAALARRAGTPRSRVDLSAFSDEEIDELAALAERVEAAGGEPAWTENELAVLSRLEAKLAAARGGVGEAGTASRPPGATPTG